MKRSDVNEAFGLAYWAMAILVHEMGFPWWCVALFASSGAVNWFGSWYQAYEEIRKEEEERKS